MPNRNLYKIEWVERAYWPRYILVMVDNPSWQSLYDVQRVDFVSHVIRFSDQALVVPDKTVRNFMVMADDRGFVGDTDDVSRARLKSGQRFLFAKNSPFFGLEGKIVLDKGGYIVIECMGMEMASEVKVPYSMIGDLL